MPRVPAKMGRSLFSDPLFSRDHLSKSFGETFDQFLKSFFETNQNDVLSILQNKVEYPKADVIRNDDNIEFRISVPGLKIEDIDISVEERTGMPEGYDNESYIIVSGKSVSDYEEKKDSYLIKEIRSSSFKRAWVTKHDIDSDKIEAKLSEGILNIKVPFKERKVESKKHVKKIAINS